MAAPIFLDSHSTTPLDPRVFEAMRPYFTERFGNAGSITHAYGHEAADAVEQAREQVARALGAEAREIVFTSGATEANNLAIKGAAEANASRGRHIVTCATEHRAVLDPCRRLERQGCELTVLPVREDGTLDLDQLRAAIRPDTILVTIMHANNEIGLIHDIEPIGAICAERGVAFHTDATQSAGKLAIDVDRQGVHLLSLSAHKFYGPKGVGALYVRRRGGRVRLAAQMDGGGHERGLRSGTLNVPAIIGMGRAIEIACAERDEEDSRVRRLRDRLRDRLFAQLDAIELNGAAEPRLPQNLNVAFHYVDSAALLNAVPEIAVSTGSACSSADPEPSHVLLALGKGEEHAKTSVRFGLTRWTTEEQVDRAAELVVAAVRRLREFSPLYRMGG